MGEVYRARDTRLDRTVAIKVLPTSVSGDHERRSRLQREAKLVASLQHPHICTLFDFGHQEGVDYLVMEYLEGETLSQRLERGSLGVPEVLKIGEEIAGALDEAHHRGIVHRDIKPGNIMLTRTGAKLLDFGLASLHLPMQMAADATVDQTLTQPGILLGTLPYIAPEQAEGKTADARSDIFSLGSVLYEMASGKRAFAGDSSARILASVLTAQPAPLEKVPRPVEETIFLCLAKDPGERWQSARDLKLQLQSFRESSHHTRLLEVQRADVWSRRTRYAAIAIVVAAVVIGILLSARWLRRGPSYAVSPVSGRRSVAVLGFKNLSGRPDVNWVSTALSEMLRSELAAGDQLRAIPGENVARMRVDLALPDSPSLARDTLAKIRQNLGSDLIVNGSYLDVNGQVRVDINLQDASKGETLATLTQSGTEQQLAELVDRSGSELRQKCGVQAMTADEAAQAKAVVPSNPEATRLYAEGLARLRVFDALGARDQLEKAITADPDFAMAHSALASAWASLGYDENAAREAKRALDLSTKLGQEERLAIETTYREMSHDNDGAVESSRKLFELHPDNIDYGLRLARLQVSAAHPKDALTTLAGLRNLPAPDRDDPRIDLQEAAASHAISDPTHALASAEAAITKGTQRGARLIVARGKFAQCKDQRDVGQHEKAMQSCREAAQIFTAVGDRASAAGALNGIANTLSDQGDTAGAKKLYEQVLGTYREIGNDYGAAGALDNLASMIEVEGKFDQAQKLSEESLALYRKIGDKLGESEDLNNIAGRLVLMGKFPEAEKMFNQSLAILRVIGDKGREAIALNNIGEIKLGEGHLAEARQTYEQSAKLFESRGEMSRSAYPLNGLAAVLLQQGDLAGAKKNFQLALERSQQAGEKPEIAQAAAGLADVAFAQNDLGEAKKQYQQALGLRKETSDVANAADTLVSLSRLAIAEGAGQEAVNAAREAVSGFKKAGMGEGETLAHAALARALLNVKNVAEAQREIAAAGSSFKQTHNERIRLEFQIQAATVAAATGNAAQQVTALQRVVADARRFGFVPAELEARFAMAELNQRTKNGAAHEQFASLKKDAEEKGFKFIATRAAARLQP
jgi:eukaryotic-like serine/threonine-protein kinase